MYAVGAIVGWIGAVRYFRNGSGDHDTGNVAQPGFGSCVFFGCGFSNVISSILWGVEKRGQLSVEKLPEKKYKNEEILIKNCNEYIRNIILTLLLQSWKRME